jgi:glutathione S-transferase
MALQLYIGNKNYSSWSMRPWVLLTGAGIPFEEHLVRFDSFDAQSAFKSVVGAINPVGKVPVLVDDGFAVWDTLAIAEYLAERFPEKNLWPVDARARARARSVCAEMHSGFHIPAQPLPDEHRGLAARDRTHRLARPGRCARRHGAA